MARKEEIVRERLRKISELRRKGIEAYPTQFDKKHSALELQEKYKKLKAGSWTKNKVSVAGRVKVIRNIGKLIFANLEDESGKIQIQLQEKETAKKQMEFFKKYIDVGDFIGLNGKIIRTKRGELSVLISKVELLSKALLPLPEKWHGLQDKEERYRKRYLDLIMNPEIKKVFEKRDEIIEAMREFLKKNNYVEVHTPILQPIYGGALARPFESKLNALNMDVYMRISNELYLKRLIVGGYEKIFEFSKDFRNEGIDYLHNPEFLQMETMWAYADYKDNMKFAEEMLKEIAKKVTGKYVVDYQGKKINFGKWGKMSMVEAVKKYAKINVKKKSEKQLRAFARKNKIKVEEGGKGMVIAAIFEEFCEKNLIQPTIIYDYPTETCGLAKPKKKEPEFAERFEIFINSWEIANSYSELNDPKVLEDYWKKQEKKKGEHEKMDKDFINALKVGMPPTSGLGIGMERLIMLLTNQPSIRDVILFPFMKPEGK